MPPSLIRYWQTILVVRARIMEIIINFKKPFFSFVKSEL